MKLNSLKGALVQIYPGDSTHKYGIIEDMTDNGILFKITDTGLKSGYTVGALHFISYSARLSFEVIRTAKQNQGKEPE